MTQGYGSHDKRLGFVYGWSVFALLLWGTLISGVWLFGFL